MRCAECGNQAFVVLDDRQLLAHLQGRQVIGIYPLLPDDVASYLRSISTAARGALTRNRLARTVRAGVVAASRHEQ